MFVFLPFYRSSYENTPFFVRRQCFMLIGLDYQIRFDEVWLVLGQIFQKRGFPMMLINILPMLTIQFLC